MKIHAILLLLTLAAIPQRVSAQRRIVVNTETPIGQVGIQVLYQAEPKTFAKLDPANFRQSALRTCLIPGKQLPEGIMAMSASAASITQLFEIVTREVVTVTKVKFEQLKLLKVVQAFDPRTVDCPVTIFTWVVTS